MKSPGNFLVKHFYINDHKVYDNVTPGNGTR